jgi:NHL repeat
VLDSVAVTKLSGGPTLISPLYPIEGAIAGLGNSTGLVLSNGTETLKVPPGSTSFKFATLQSSGAAYRVAVATQPSGVNCVVNNGVGTVASAAVSNVSVVCSAQTFTLGGTVVGLGNVLGLSLSNGAQTLAIPAGASSFTFPNALPLGGAFSVSVKTQPQNLTCSVADNAGIIASANVTNVAVTCSAISNTLGGSVSGLVTNGLILTSGGQSLPVLAGQTSFTFAALVASGGNYAVTVQSNPLGYTCTPGNNTGVMGNSPITSVTMACTVNSFTLGGTITGLGVAGLVLSAGGQTLAINAGSSSFTFGTALAYGTSFSVAVQSPASGLSCTINNGAGVMPNAAVTDVAVSCNSSTFSVGGTVSGLSSAGLVLMAGGQFVAVNSGATAFTLPSPFAFGSGYTVAIQTQPVGNTCSVSNATGSVTGAITNVSVVCSLPSYSLGGSVSGFTVGSGLTLTNGGQDVNILAASSSFAFPIALTRGSVYNVSVKTQPPGYNCTIVGASGTMGNGAVSNIDVTCAVLGPAVSTIAGPLGMTISGLAVGADGSLYWSADVRHSIYKRDPSGTITLIGGRGDGALGYVDGTVTGSRFSYPKGIAIDSFGNLYVADTGNNVIRKMTPSQVWSTFAGSTSGTAGFDDGSRSPGNTTPVGTFTDPNSIGIDAANTLYVASSGRCACVRVIPVTGDQVSTVNTPLIAGVTAVTASVPGYFNLLTPDGAIVSYTIGGSFVFGLGEGKVIQFNGHLARDQVTGDTWAVSAAFEYVYRLQNATPGGFSSIVSFGSGNTGYLDGPANQASFTNPGSTAVNSQGQVFIGDGQYIRQLIP